MQLLIPGRGYRYVISYTPDANSFDYTFYGITVAPTRNQSTLRHELIHGDKEDHNDKRTNVLYAPLPIRKEPSPTGAYPQLDAKTVKFLPWKILMYL